MADLTRGRFDGASRSDLSYPLYEFLDLLVPLQAFAVVVIDEAQNLSLPLLEEIRILSELERREKLLQVVLVGQPELRSSLRLPEMRQVDQRVSVRCELTALDADGVGGYVNHRLGVAGRARAGVEFTGPALEAIYQGSAGVPRLINRIGDRALQRAYVSRTMPIDAPFVWTAIGDLGLTTTAETARNRHRGCQRRRPVLLRFLSRRRSGCRRSRGRRLTRSVKRPCRPAGVPRRERALAGLPMASLLARAQRWVAGAAVAILAVSVSVAAIAWPRSAKMTRARPWPCGTATSHIHAFRAGQRPRASRHSQRPRSPCRPRRPPTPWRLRPPFLRHAAAIRFWSHRSRAGTRAERLVEELTNAGYGAHAVERNGGPAQAVSRW